MAIEIVDLPIKHGDFPWQNVSLPEGNAIKWILLNAKDLPMVSLLLLRDSLRVAVQFVKVRLREIAHRASINLENLPSLFAYLSLYVCMLFRIKMTALAAKSSICFT